MKVKLKARLHTLAYVLSDPWLIILIIMVNYLCEGLKLFRPHAIFLSCKRAFKYHKTDSSRLILLLRFWKVSQVPIVYKKNW